MTFYFSDFCSQGSIIVSYVIVVEEARKQTIGEQVTSGLYAMKIKHQLCGFMTIKLNIDQTFHMPPVKNKENLQKILWSASIPKCTYENVSTKRAQRARNLMHIKKNQVGEDIFLNNQERRENFH